MINGLLVVIGRDILTLESIWLDKNCVEQHEPSIFWPVSTEVNSCTFLMWTAWKVLQGRDLSQFSDFRWIGQWRIYQKCIYLKIYYQSCFFFTSLIYGVTQYAPGLYLFFCLIIFVFVHIMDQVTLVFVFVSVCVKHVF